MGGIFIKNNLKKGFTIVEVLVVIAISGVLTGTVAPKLVKQMRKATVAKVQNNLGIIRSRLSQEIIFLEEYPNLYDEENANLLESYSIESTPAFTDADGESHEATSKVVYTRTDDGGWLYNIEEGEMYANLPDGAYTKDDEYEIWGGETTITPEITYNASENNLSYGTLQFYNEETDKWEDMVDGDTYSSDTEIRYLPDPEYVLGSTNKIDVGTGIDEDGNLKIAEVEDWGVVDGNTATMTLKDGTIITTTLTSTDSENPSGDLKAYNNINNKGIYKNDIGVGIGSTETSTGLNKNQTLTIDVDGEDINKVVFTLDGLGSYFDEDSKNATMVEITAYYEDGKIVTQSSYRSPLSETDTDKFSDEYTFEVSKKEDNPISYFELTTEGSNGTYVVQNVSLIKSAQDQVSLTVENPDGTTEVITKDILLDDTNLDEAVSIIETEEEEA